MTRETVMARGRIAALAGMVDMCTIQRRTGSSTDQDTGVATPTYSSIYSGQCRFQVAAPSASPADVGQEQVFIQQTILQLPMTATGIDNEDVVTCTASVNDPDLVVRKYWVKGILRKTHTTARRLSLEEVD